MTTYPGEFLAGVTLIALIFKYVENIFPPEPALG